MQEYSEKIVLIDIIPRELKNKTTIGEIDLSEANFTTHAVLLYRVGDTNELLAIDPNNLTFSAHLKKFNADISLIDLQNKFTITTFYSVSEKHQIYSKPSGTKAGSKATEYRDCIDIAVKLAFLLNEDPKDYRNIQDVMDSDSVKYVTNNNSIVFSSFTKGNLIRLKQSSDINQIKECYKLMKEQDDKYLKEIGENIAKEKQLEAELKACRAEAPLIIAKYNIQATEETLNLQSQYEKYHISVFGQDNSDLVDNLNRD